MTVPNLQKGLNGFKCLFAHLSLSGPSGYLPANHCKIVMSGLVLAFFAETEVWEEGGKERKEGQNGPLSLYS